MIKPPRKSREFERKLRGRLPNSRTLRIALGLALVLGGLVGFFPVVGFWMLPLGLAVLSVDVPAFRKVYRKIFALWHKWRRRRRADATATRASQARSGSSKGGQAQTGPAIRFADVVEAAARLAGQAVTTPLIENEYLNELAGGRVLIKAECLQRTGSYKFRGAFNRLSVLGRAERQSGVVAFSSGNHAQGVALAAKLLAIPAVIVMPRDAPAAKIEGTRRYGAEIVFYDRWSESREEVAATLARERDAVLVPSYDDPFVMAGQGTTGMEIAKQADGAGARLDDILIPFGGGGLSSGIATALGQLSPQTRIYTVEPEGFDDMRRSLGAGKRQENIEGPRSICDALLAPSPGALTFPILKAAGAQGLVVSDQEAELAMVFAARHLKLVVEPGGAVALAALLTGKINTAGRSVCVVISGGNVDLELYTRVLSKGAVADGDS